MDVLVISLLGMLAFGGLFLIMCPEWWSTSLGTLKEKKPEAGDTEARKSNQ